MVCVLAKSYLNIEIRYRKEKDIKNVFEISENFYFL